MFKVLILISFLPETIKPFYLGSLASGEDLLSGRLLF